MPCDIHILTLGTMEVLVHLIASHSRRHLPVQVGAVADMEGDEGSDIVYSVF